MKDLVIEQKETYFAKCAELKEHYTFRAISLEDAFDFIKRNLNASKSWEVGQIARLEESVFYQHI